MEVHLNETSQTLNCVELFLNHAEAGPYQAAIWRPDQDVVTFGELKSIAAKTQRALHKQRIGPGDPVLIFDSLTPRLYGAIIGILAMGCPLIFAEPWMSIPNLDHAIATARPKLFLTSFLGRMWGLRSKAIRAIPEWMSLGSIKSVTEEPFRLERMPADSIGVVTFTSGTTGKPKSVVRTHGALVTQHALISEAIQSHRYTKPDLCIWGNFALTNLASGRCSLLVPATWSPKVLASLDHLPPALQPQTLTCGPAFLRMMLQHTHLPSLQSVVVGGALTDCKLFIEGFNKWPQARWLHAYGSSEAEPVSLEDARLSVHYSQEQGFFQTVHIGSPISEISANLEPDGAWVSGRHICPFYLGNDEANRTSKRVDADGRLWHSMGDRILASDKGWWYGGRSHQHYSDFLLEQKIYSCINHSDCFIHRGHDDELYLIGERIKQHRQLLLDRFESLSGLIETTVYRDRRHRARIDRTRTLNKRGIP